LRPMIQAKTQLTYNLKEMKSEQADLLACPAGENRTIHFVPTDILGYQWSNCFKLEHYWRQISDEVKQLDPSQSKINEFEGKIGMNVANDILPAFGEEIGGYLKDIQVGGFFPLPEFLLFVEVNNESKAEQLLGRLQQQPLVSLQEENYGGTLIKYLALPLGENIQPGYCFLENYLLPRKETDRLLQYCFDSSFIESNLI